MNKRLMTCAIVPILSYLISSASLAEMNFGKDVDSSLPIEILSDSLTVKTQENIAIFLGDVRATQGQVKLMSDQMDVYYYSDNNTKNTVELPEEAASGIAQSITKIRVGGNVIFTTPGKKASSDLGTYDVAKGFVILQGNVVLNNEGQTIKGEKFIHNVKEGTSRMLSGGDIKHNKNVETGKAKSRVKGLFIPRSKAK